MKIYESPYTYVPFVYFYLIGSLFGVVYHKESFHLYQPYILWIFMLINTFVYYLHDTDMIIKHTIHRHIWKTVTVAIFGILMNNIHTEMFRDFHFESHNINMLVSLIYSLLLISSVYFLDYLGLSITIHVIFGFFPLSRVWQVNLYMYIVYTTLSIILMYRRLRISSLKDTTYHVRPVVNYFMYLRLHDFFIVLGIFQLYLEYYKSVLPDVRERAELIKFLKEERPKIHRKKGYKNSDGGDDLEVQSLVQETSEI